MSMDLASIPWNLVAWSYSAITLLLFARRNRKLSDKSSNVLHKQFADFMLAIGIALAVYALPGLYIKSPETLRITTAIGDTLIALALILNLRLMHTLKLLNNLTYKLASGVVVLASIVVLIYGVTSNEIIIADYTLYHLMHPLSSLIFSGLFIGTLAPTGYLFIKKSLQIIDKKQRRHTFMLGFTYLLAAAIGTFNYGIRSGGQDLISTALVFLSFSVLLILSLTPVKQRSLEHSAMR